MHRHSREGYDGQRLHHASSRHPVSRGIPVVTKNSDGYTAEKEQRPEAASQPSPFQHSLQVILVEKPPTSRNRLAGSDVVPREHNAKRAWPKTEKSSARQRVQCHA